MTHVGWLYQIIWSNPYTDPPTGYSRIKAEMFESVEQREFRSTHGEYACPVPKDFAELHQLGDGYCVAITAICTPSKQLSKEALASVRRKRLERKVKNKFPLFAEQMIADEINRNPDYFKGITREDLQLKHDEAIVEEQAIYERFIDGQKTRMIVVNGTVSNKPTAPIEL